VDINQQKEQFSSNFVRVVAAVVGYALYKPEVDEDSVDWGIAAKGGIGSIYSPRLELQLKSTSRDAVGMTKERSLSLTISLIRLW
jgi:hypothetical protein